MSDVMDWDAAYNGQIFAGPPPWNIGAPQPVIADLISTGQVHAPVLDAGCGVGDLTIALAEAGHDVTGTDISTAAIDQATKRAAERGVEARFIQGDARNLAALGLDHPQFNTIIDCTLFHSLPLDARDDYLRGIHAAANSGARLYLLVFTTDALPADSPCPVPNLVTDDEIRTAVAKYWTIDAIEPSHVAVRLPDIPNLPKHDFHTDDNGLTHLPALFLTAHKP
ncbi:class I SAM-dependent methyltransferase [Mycobacterium sp. 852013-50091_SCH5140682]|uniref:class I SAM-dependent methyltransferase n=1 Tax=Mycobacterium sp. 852013-50091_SCH5140682 TaxID=1834109 RepID=UPI001E5FD487|nr:class I SAM-dependent methyltransferase [Mycobacterium sp. 852013-50091_SCH5140682]